MHLQFVYAWPYTVRFIHSVRRRHGVDGPVPAGCGVRVFIYSFSAVHPAQRASFWAFVSFLRAISRRRAADLSAHVSR